MRLGIIAVLALAAVGCDANASRRDSSRETPVAADNTDRNDRDRNMDTLTPGDQAETDADRTITQQIRQQVVGHDDLSITAANIKIITVAGVVTLRGPVNSEQERATIVALSQRVANVRRVDNQLEVAAN